ncbi:MAG: hypothetical protein KDC24_08145 [Saprospiraceae bacterium]|nr:hypothetical protein [Saprospiraceae bacterium]
MTKLEDFVVLKHIKVCDLKIQSKQVSATYEIQHFNGEKEQTRLIYSYQEKLFDKKSLTDWNLASMMVAQVAFNYGLFCEELIFEGYFEEADKSFIQKMTENTSREIITNKLLVENEFLTPAFKHLSVEPKQHYTQAKIIFESVSNASPQRNIAFLASSPSKFSILSSGGKDSLLSYGLLKEIGEPYPVFVNESGRHWFTAVNAYKFFKAEEPNTSKVWCNSDRVFNWMLRHFSFIRKDYNTLRSDMYPIRLWTVGVFLFGVLPLTLKKGIGNIIVGDEYDTTVKQQLAGITHYSGLYDQSKYFDNALTRYYLKKGWKLYQYSLLRSMSELLIMKVLLERYGDLQQHQVSCHAAHASEGKMLPCGTCEKCRRIIGMISALDGDPKRCGYTEAQIKQALSILANKKIKQIGSDASQLFFLLNTKGLLPGGEAIKKVAKEHPEVLQLRFDNERSSLEDLPEYIREPLFEILKKYANGAVKRTEAKWQSVNLDKTFLHQSKYKFHESAFE